MFYRIRQLLRYIYPNLKKEDINFAKQFLTREEFILFNNMISYDKKHSINILRDVLKEDQLKDNKKMIKLALLHDIGKEKSIGIIKRISYVLFKNVQSLKEHPKKAYDLLKALDEELANLALGHHNNKTEDFLMKKFQEIDDKN